MEKSGDTAVFTFGRLNPPTTGHGKLIDAMGIQQSNNAGSKMHVFVSHSQDAKKNPLDYKRKVAKRNDDDFNKGLGSIAGVIDA